MSYVSWTIVAVIALAAIIVFLFVPGLAILAAIALAVALLAGLVLLAARHSARSGDTTPDIIERRDEFEETHRHHKAR